MERPVTWLSFFKKCLDRDLLARRVFRPFTGTGRLDTSGRRSWYPLVDSVRPRELRGPSKVHEIDRLEPSRTDEHGL